MKTIYFVESDGICALVEANSAEKARKLVETQRGTDNGPYHAREATEDDKDWVFNMGGKVLHA